MLALQIIKHIFAHGRQRQRGGRRRRGHGLFENKPQSSYGVIQRHGEIFAQAPAQNPINERRVREGR
jgi:hypothetical protein